MNEDRAIRDKQRLEEILRHITPQEAGVLIDLYGAAHRRMCELAKRESEKG